MVESKNLKGPTEILNSLNIWENEQFKQSENLNQISTEEESDAPCCGCEWLDCDNEVKTKL